MWNLVHCPGVDGYYEDLVKLCLLPLDNRRVCRLEVLQRHYESYVSDPRVQHSPTVGSILFEVAALTEDEIFENHAFRDELRSVWKALNKKRKKRNEPQQAGTAYVNELENLPMWLASIYVPHCPRLRRRHEERMVQARERMAARNFT